MNLKKLSTEPYKGVRDFYPPDMAVHNYISSVWKRAVKRFGYEEYNASVLEPSDLYKAKTGEEIVSEQTYTFKDRGGRDVTLRPEMTPTVARMVAARKRELVFPLRWFSIPNLFRYENPQRGRLREHWQLNVDIFGVESLQAEIEVIQIAYTIMKDFGLKDTDFEIRLNSRRIMNYIFSSFLGLDSTQSHALGKLIDKKDKIGDAAFSALAKDICGDSTGKLVTLLNSKNFEEFSVTLGQTKEEHEGLREVHEVMKGLEDLGIRNVVFDQSLMRGFDYYTGVVFEVFDLNPANRRSVFGGGRYDELLSIFGGDSVTAVGFGAGDVIAREILETYGTLPSYKNPTHFYLIPTELRHASYANELAQKLRANDYIVAVDYTERKLGDKIKNADKMKIPEIIIIGEEEVASGKLKIKNLATGKERPLNQ